MGKQNRLEQNQKVVPSPPIFPSDPVAAEYCQWFWRSSSGWDWIYGTAPTPQTKTEWKTENKFPIQPLELWQRFLAPNEAIGVRFKKLADYLLLDIDWRSPNHPANNPSQYMGLIYTLREIGLNGYLAVRSSWSGGIHLIFPLPKPVEALRLAIRARLVLESQGFKLCSGALELFPNTKSYVKSGEYSLFNGHRLPLQPGSGSYLLDDALEPKSNRVEDLLQGMRLKASLQDMERLESGLNADYEKFKQSRFNRASSATDKWRQYLESASQEGWTGAGQTNSLLLLFGAYARVFLKLEGEKLAAKIVEMAKSTPRYNQYCQHQHEIERRAQDVAKSAERYYWKLGSEPSRSGTYAENFHRDWGSETGTQQPIANNIANFYTAAEAQERIKQAVADLEESDMLPSTAAARSAAIIATAKKLTGKGISQTTLQKNRHLWHPNDYQSTGGCVQPPTEPISGDFTPLEPTTNPPPNQPQSAQRADVHTSPVYEGFVAVGFGGAAPQEPLAPPNDVEQLGGYRLTPVPTRPVHNVDDEVGCEAPVPVKTQLETEKELFHSQSEIQLKKNDQLEKNEKDLLPPQIQVEGDLFNQPNSATVANRLLEHDVPHLLSAAPPQPTLAELVVQKAHLWKNAQILRPMIQHWIEETPGVVLGESGPELAVEANHPNRQMNLEPPLTSNTNSVPVPIVKDKEGKQNETTEPQSPWYAERIKPRAKLVSPFKVGQRVRYEDRIYRIAIPGNPRSQLEGIKFAVPNEWIEPLEPPT